MNSITTTQATTLFGSATGGETNSTRTKALEFLGKGLKPGVVSTLLGVTPATISQFLAEPEFKEAVAAILVTSQMAHSIRAERLDALEDKIITSVERSIDFFVKPADALMALKVINSLDRKVPINPINPDSIETRTVVLNLPAHMHNSVVNIQVNSSNEVVEVNGREMRTMPTGQVLQQLEIQQAEHSLNLEKENEQRRNSRQQINSSGQSETV